MERIRCFISVDIPEEIREKIKNIQEKLPEFRGKKTEEENLHLTLKFLGEISEEKVEKVREKLRGVSFEKFGVEVDNIGVFSEKFIRIVWLHLTNCEELQKLVDRVLSEVGFETEKRFMSHLTIARVKNVRDKEEFLESWNKIEFQGIKFFVDRFKLKKSTLTKEGPVYQTIEGYMLM